MNKLTLQGIFQIILAAALLGNFGLAQKNKKTLSAEDYFKRGLLEKTVFAER